MKLPTDDIVFADTGLVFHFCYLPWDSDFFDLPCYSLDQNKSKIGSSPLLERQMSACFPKAFVSAKIDSQSDYGAILSLTRAGFYYIETELTLEFRYAPNQLCFRAGHDDITVLKLDCNEGVQNQDFGSVFTMTRFHTDPHITKEKADLLWVKYLKNFIPDSRRHMFVAKQDERVVGVILVHEYDQFSQLFFVAVAPDCQEKGIGSTFIQAVIDRLPPKRIETGTQAKNLGGLNFYMRNGFTKIRSTKVVMHRWSGIFEN